MVKISSQKPPVHFLLRLVFKYDWERTAVSFGDTVYMKYPDKMSDHLSVHEGTHLDQQHHSALYAWYWWAKYICSKRFRLKQELEAYQKQYAYVVKYMQWCINPPHFLNSIAKDLSGGMYGNIITYEEACRSIKNNG